MKKILSVFLSIVFFAYTFALPSYAEFENDSEIQPRSIVNTFVGYTQLSTSENYEYKQIAMTRVDNTTNHDSETILVAETYANGSISGSISAGLGLSGEINAMFGSISASTSLSVSMNVSWTSGSKYSVTTTIPANKVGVLRVYKIGVTTTGISTYRRYNTTTEELVTFTEHSGASFPTNDVNFKVTIEN